MKIIAASRTFVPEHHTTSYAVRQPDTENLFEKLTEKGNPMPVCSGTSLPTELSYSSSSQKKRKMLKIERHFSFLFYPCFPCQALYIAFRAEASSDSAVLIKNRIQTVKDVGKFRNVDHGAMTRLRNNNMVKQPYPEHRKKFICPFCRVDIRLRRK